MNIKAFYFFVKWAKATFSTLLVFTCPLVKTRGNSFKGFSYFFVKWAKATFSPLLVFKRSGTNNILVFCGWSGDATTGSFFLFGFTFPK